MPPDNAPPPSFLGFLGNINYGEFAGELAEELAKLLKAMEDAELAGQKQPGGKLSISLALKRVDGVVEVRTDVAVKAPKVVRPRSLFYPTADGGLARQDPRQAQLPLVSVPALAARGLAG